MNRKLIVFVFILSQLTSAFAIDASNVSDADAALFIKEELIPYINAADKSIYKNLKPINLCDSNLAFGPQGRCAAYLLDLVKDNYRGGAIGVIDRAKGDGDYSTPDKICGRITSPYSVADYMKEVNASIYAKTIPKNLLLNSQSCMDSLKTVKWDKGQRDRAQQFILSKMVYSDQRLNAAYRNMLESKSQLDLILGKEKSEDCRKYPNSEIQSFCQTLESCTNSKADSRLSEKTDELTNALNTIMALNLEIAKYDELENETEKIEKLQAGIKSIKTLYPILENPDFKTLMNKTHFWNKFTNAEVKSAIRADLGRVRTKVNGQLKQLNLASKCITGESTQCSGLEVVLNDTAPDWKDTEKLPYESYYSCVEKSKTRRDSDNKMLADAAIVASMSLLPMGAVGIAGSLYKAGKVIKTTTALIKLTKAVDIASTIGDVTLAELELGKIYGACKAQLNTLVDYQNSKPTCEVIENKVALTTDVNKCHQQIISGVLSTVLTGVGLGMLKYSDDALLAGNGVIDKFVKKSDTELARFFDDIAPKIKNPKDRLKLINELNSRLIKVAKSKEYTTEEIQAAMKVFLKKCGK
ncbi:MAG: hypothetical protein K2Q18_03815 [Bdellovibrionales bacterium]|nr:hypothetical protein [Bdellovibrionales bacterium]